MRRRPQPRKQHARRRSPRPRIRSNSCHSLVKPLKNRHHRCRSRCWRQPWRRRRPCPQRPPARVGNVQHGLRCSRSRSHQRRARPNQRPEGDGRRSLHTQSPQRCHPRMCGSSTSSSWTSRTGSARCCRRPFRRPACPQTHPSPSRRCRLWTNSSTAPLGPSIARLLRAGPVPRGVSPLWSLRRRGPRPARSRPACRSPPPSWRVSSAARRRRPLRRLRASPASWTPSPRRPQRPLAASAARASGAP
mmetsp:Transcript_28700/g.83040  ORF Transcript_28700/g.83040 Transcript_28700/m.83040 type:complete len:247 (-) Transcript_28700:999-1739(-)